MKYAAAIAVIAAAAVAAADPETDADHAFQVAEQHAHAGDPHAIDELEGLGRMRPVTRWTDDAWSEAARLAERTGDVERARLDLEQVLATTSDDIVRQRARAELARLASFAGAHGEWSAVAAEHERAEARLAHAGDPRPTLGELEALVTAHPGYPRAWAVMIEIGDGWDRDGQGDRALGWLRRAQAAAPAGADRVHATAELARALVRHGDLDAASDQIAALDDRVVASSLRRELERAELRRTLHWIALAVLAVLLALAAGSLWRASGSWRAAGRRVVRPPVEALFFVPIAIVLAIVAATGNPLVARAVRAIVIAGAVTAWLSGAILDAVRARFHKVGRGRALAHGLAALMAVAAATYVAIDRDRVIDLVIDTWHEGPELR